MLSIKQQKLMAFALGGTTTMLIATLLMDRWKEKQFEKVIATYDIIADFGMESYKRLSEVDPQAAADIGNNAMFAFIIQENFEEQ